MTTTRLSQLLPVAPSDEDETDAEARGRKCNCSPLGISPQTP